MARPIFRVKRAGNSQDTVDYIVQRAARKNISGNPGLSTSTNVLGPNPGDSTTYTSRPQYEVFFLACLQALKTAESYKSVVYEKGLMPEVFLGVNSTYMYMYTPLSTENAPMKMIRMLGIIDSWI